MNDDKTSPTLEIKGKKVTMDVDAPLVFRFERGGVFEIEYYQAVFGHTDALTMELRFSPEAAGQLVKCIKKLLDEGVIIIKESSSNSTPQ
jgi:hypothetical protein